jgi:hypothetical protein
MTVFSGDINNIAKFPGHSNRVERIAPFAYIRTNYAPVFTNMEGS